MQTKNEKRGHWRRAIWDGEEGVKDVEGETWWFIVDIYLPREIMFFGCHLAQLALY